MAISKFYQQSTEADCTMIPNEILTGIVTGGHSPTEMKILLYLCNFTYGRNEKSSELYQRASAWELGLHQSTFSKALKSLKDRRVIIQNDSKEYYINSDLEQWEGEWVYERKIKKPKNVIDFCDYKRSHPCDDKPF